jgi:hypothetical protein
MVICSSQPSCLALENQTFLLDKQKWSIPLKPCSIPDKPVELHEQSKSGDETSCAIPSRPSYRFLTKPKSSQITAVLKVFQACPAILNPGGFEYGPIPELKKLTVNDAQILWGKPLSSSDDHLTKTYRLQDANDAEYLLDLKFEKKKIVEYRVRSQQLRGDAKWCSLNYEVGG